MKRLISFIAALFLIVPLFADRYEISTANTTLLLETATGRRVNFVYYGPRVNSIDEIYNTNSNIGWNASPCF